MKIDIPYYKQTTDFTCGPACVLMALKFLEPKIRLSRELEFDIWRKSNLVSIKATTPSGLASACLKRGFKTKIICKKEGIFQTIAKDSESKEISLFAAKNLFNEAKSLGSKIEHRDPIIDDIKITIQEKRVPIVLIHMGIIHDKDTLHFVVVSGIENDRVWINDPYSSKGRKDINLELTDFKKMMNETWGKRRIYKRLLVIYK
jgi:predicted double-glycine peptidase